MKKIVILCCIIALSFGVMGASCLNNLKHPCTQATQTQITDAEIILKGIQAVYNPLQALVAAIPTAGPIIAAAAPIALAAADVALQNLGTIIASNCANDPQVTLAQIALNTIENLFKLPEVQQALQTPAAQAKLKALKAK
jgi:hypothetical protein